MGSNKYRPILMSHKMFRIKSFKNQLLLRPVKVKLLEYNILNIHRNIKVKMILRLNN